MDTYTNETYGESYAEVYDDWHGSLDEATVERLYELAGGGRALELGVGTGRVALPLAVGVGLDGAARVPAPARALVGLAARALRLAQHEARLRLRARGAREKFRAGRRVR